MQLASDVASRMLIHLHHQNRLRKSAKAVFNPSLVETIASLAFKVLVEIEAAIAVHGAGNRAQCVDISRASRSHALAYERREVASGKRALERLEASGNSSLDLALTLQAHRQVEVSVVNPRRARRFAESLGERSKTDPVDARVLCQYALRMPWIPWVPPDLLALRLRSLTRAIEALGVMHTQEKNRQHSLLASQALPRLVIRELQQHLDYLELRITRLRREAHDSSPATPNWIAVSVSCLPPQESGKPVLCKYSAN
jgi:transposase